MIYRILSIHCKTNNRKPHIKH